jgi:arylsulfatase A
MFQHRSNGIYREGKRSIYEGGHRVPFFVRWPAGIVAPGRQWANPICQTDIFATLADLVGAELPANAGEDSQSFYSVLINETPEVSRGPIIHHAANGRFGIRDEKWKLCLPHENSAAELYDLEADPGETRDLAGSHPDIVRRLSARATSFVVQGRSTPGEPQKNDTDYWDDLTWMSPVEYRQE